MLTARERFEANVDRSPGHGSWGNCHVWTGRPNTSGYGWIMVDGRRVGSHVAAWYFETGEWPEDPTPCTLHICDNTLCVRTDSKGLYPANGFLRPRRGHLFLGTQDDNIADRHDKGRTSVMSRNRGRANPSVKLTEQQIAEIKALRGIRTQRELAEEYGVHKNHIGRIQRGERWG